MMRPEDIKSRTFTNTLRGYDRDEVRAFLNEVAASTRELGDQLAVAEAQISAPEPPESDDEHDGLDDAAQTIVDRYGALGNRIADLLRHADESAAAIVQQAHDDAEEMRSTAAADAAHQRSEAEQHAAELLSESRAIRFEIDTYRDEIVAELEAARNEQESALAQAKAAAETEIETFRVDSINEIEALRSEARTEVEDLRNTATSEVEELRAAAQLDADAARESAVAEGRASIEADEAEAARLREGAENDRLTARAELDDVRSEVSSLLEQARTQSEFIKQEADEIIRTKVRANFEQAQARLDVLRHTEISSRERILRAQTELSSALTRLDAEPAPELDPTSGPAVIEEAERRQSELDEPPTFDDGGFGFDEGFEAEEPFDTEIVEVGEVDQSTFEADVAEATQQIDGEGWSPLSPFVDSVPDDDAGSDEEVAGEPGFAAVEFGVTGDSAGEALAEVAHDSGDAAEATSSPADHTPAGNAEVVEDHAVGGPADEDALARLVREAMQEAVDSARKDD